MVVPALPVDILIHILTFLSPSRQYGENSSVHTLASFSQANRTCRDAACLPSIWENHYRIRYKHSNTEAEASRNQALQSNWRLMYGDRRRIDSRVIHLLEQILLNRKNRSSLAKALWDIGFDAWDILDLEAQQPKPGFFQTGSDSPSQPYAITRVYWAKTMMQAITRGYAFTLWSRLNISGEFAVPFSKGYSAISCFFGHPPTEMNSLTDELISGCREFLVAQGVPFSSQQPGYDSGNVARLICEFMQTVGFGHCQRPDYRNASTHLPHSYLSIQRRCIPISLVHVFVTICRGLGIAASPIPFPQRVLAHVATPNPNEEDIFVDVFDATIMTAEDDLYGLMAAHDIPPDKMAGYITPCGVREMLLRSARNINLHSSNSPRITDHGATLLFSFSVYMLLSEVVPDIDVSGMMKEATVVDFATWVSHSFAPFLKTPDLAPKLLGRGIQVAKEDANVASRFRSMQAISIQYFVGMVFEHRGHDNYIGCIIGWDARCQATEDWIQEMNIDSLPRGKKQPFYTVLHLDGSQRYVAEDAIGAPTALSRDKLSVFFTDIVSTSMHFSDVDVVQRGGQIYGRFVPSPDLMKEYPEDDHAGHTWLDKDR